MKRIPFQHEQDVAGIKYLVNMNQEQELRIRYLVDVQIRVNGYYCLSLNFFTKNSLKIKPHVSAGRATRTKQMHLNKEVKVDY